MSIFKFTNSLLRLKDDLLDFIYPQSCPICKEPVSQDVKGVCENCWSILAILPHSFCPYCKSFFEEEDLVLRHHCLFLNRFEERRIMAVRSLGTFDDYYKILIHRFKYERKIPLGKRLAQSLGEKIVLDMNLSKCDLVIPVPLHRARKRERGFNQSEILAEGVSKVLDVATLNTLLKRKKNTKDQTRLNVQQRKENVEGAFAVTHPDEVTGKWVILVDDVMTTGATLNECAKMLLEAGAERIFAVTLAVVAE
ncbi:MAG: ComF family protein [Candidatus Zixiibacteriota bacterium]